MAALRSGRGASRRLLVGALDREFELLASVPLIVEYEAVLARPEHLAASGLNAREVSQIIDALVQVSVPVQLRFLWRPRLKDPADEMVLETAVIGNADWLVTFNTRHFVEPARDFAIRVVRPGEAWREIRTS